MSDQKLQNRRLSNIAAIDVARAAKAAKRLATPETFGQPELFIVRAGSKAFTWELRRFGGVLIDRGHAEYPSRIAAESAGAEALNTLQQTSDSPFFARQEQPRAK